MSDDTKKFKVYSVDARVAAEISPNILRVTSWRADIGPQGNVLILSLICLRSAPYGEDEETTIEIAFLLPAVLQLSRYLRKVVKEYLRGTPQEESQDPA